MLPLNKSIKIIAAIVVIAIAALAYYFSQQKTELPLMSVQEKKARFSQLIVPAVNNVYDDLFERYQDVKAVIDAGETNGDIEDLKAEYKVTSDEGLLMAIKPHPKSIAIAQAAMESSWATSRFFNEANNIFGVWSFDQDEPRIAAGQKRGDKTIWLKKYGSIEDAVYDYYRTLGRSEAFAAFRATKMSTDDPFVLVTKLDKYSEKGSAYGEELTAIIKYNKFDQYDVN